MPNWGRYDGEMDYYSMLSNVQPCLLSLVRNILKNSELVGYSSPLIIFRISSFSSRSALSDPIGRVAVELFLLEQMFIGGDAGVEHLNEEFGRLVGGGDGWERGDHVNLFLIT